MFRVADGQPDSASQARVQRPGVGRAGSVPCWSCGIPAGMSDYHGLKEPQVTASARLGPRVREQRGSGFLVCARFVGRGCLTVARYAGGPAERRSGRCA